VTPPPASVPPRIGTRAVESEAWTMTMSPDSSRVPAGAK
jgi:hypothetical protein